MFSVGICFNNSLTFFFALYLDIFPVLITLDDNIDFCSFMSDFMNSNIFQSSCVNILVVELNSVMI